MKNCPNCQSEVEDNFEVCWNCQYSFPENQIIEFSDEDKKEIDRKINSLRCEIPMIDSGNFKFHEGFKIGIFGDLFDWFQNRETFNLYYCPNCGKVEFFIPNKN